MKQILFAVLLCVCSICSAQKTTSKSPDKPQYFYVSSFVCDSFYLDIRDRYANVVDCDEPLCNILKFKRVKDNEMLLFVNEQIYRLTADYPFNVERRKAKRNRFELLGLRAKVRDFGPDMTISAKIEDSNKKTIFYREYRSVPYIDLYVAYVGKDQKPYVANLNCRWPAKEFDPQKDIRFFLKERGGDTRYPIERMSFKRFDCFDCNMPNNEGGILREDLKRVFVNRDFTSMYINVIYKNGTESVSRTYKIIR